jgi:hypothetical protein
MEKVYLVIVDTGAYDSSHDYNVACFNEKLDAENFAESINKLFIDNECHESNSKKYGTLDDLIIESKNKKERFYLDGLYGSKAYITEMEITNLSDMKIELKDY